MNNVIFFSDELNTRFNSKLINKLVSYSYIIKSKLNFNTFYYGLGLNNDINTIKEALSLDGYTIVVNLALYIKNERMLEELINYDSDKSIYYEGINNRFTLCKINNSVLASSLQSSLYDAITNINDKIVLNINADDVVVIEDFNKFSIADKLIQNRINQYHMENGVYIENPDTVIISPEALIEPGTVIYQNTKLLGNTKIGNNSEIGPNSVISNSILGDNVIVNSSMIEDSKIGNRSNIGPFAHIRMNSNILENVRLGNFVEIKNSTIGNDTFASHLAYVGDTTCGHNVNFGCGTITVNFDGKNKYRTTIGDNVFIGCNSNLIAPINVASNTFIAAGTTVTDDLEEYDFAISRNRQLTKKLYAKRYILK